jgi:hypothetical protein
MPSPIRFISLSQVELRAYIQYNDGFGDWLAQVYIEEGKGEQLVKLMTPENATSTLTAHVAIIAHLILGHPVTLEESVNYVTHQAPGYVITSFPIKS